MKRRAKQMMAAVMTASMLFSSALPVGATTKAADVPAESAQAAAAQMETEDMALSENQNDAMPLAENPDTASGTYSAIVEGFDWGPGVTKIIVSLDKEISAASVAAEKFQIAVEKQGYFGNVSRGNRTITAAYTSDANGNRIEEDAAYLTFELAVGPAIDISNPFFYDFMAGFNVWAVPYTNTITLTEGSKLQSGETEITALNIEAAVKETIKPQADQFKKGTYKSMFTSGEDITLSYASYSPAKDSKKNPLIIWLHGAGEGGTDPDIALLGNNITLLAGENVQKYFDGAYVLAPQSDSMWMNDGSGNYTKDGTSKYTEALMELIQSYVNSNADIDKDRVYIGGCSNGGYMTMNMIMNYPDYFAAAYPICEAYTDEWITDEMLKGILDLPIWFTHAANDPTVNPQSHTVATVDRLRTMGAANVHFSYFDDVHDTSGEYTGADGAPYQYNGHWSWIYTLKNECTEDGVSIMEWLSKQKKSSVPHEITTAAGTYRAVAEGFDWGPGVTKIIAGLDKEISSASVSADKFQIAVAKQSFFGNISRGNRTITAAYTSDADGNRVTGNAAYLTFELAVSPRVDISNPYFYDFMKGFNVWADPYTNTITLTEGSTLLSVGTEITELDIEPEAAEIIKPQADLFEKSTFTSEEEEMTLSYASYAPADDNKKNPLIVWLHGAGEGGTDPDIVLLGNNVTLLAGENVQNHFDGAYVLTPQSDTMWMNDGSGNYTKDGTSKYTKVLMELIRSYVNSNADIDKSRIYIGGCSNGGYMTMNMILHYPDYFAAAYPICEAYTDAWITDEMLEGIKDMPIWFTHAANDTTVKPETHTVATVDRLREMGAADVHFSYFDDVHDTSGKYNDDEGNPHQYQGHWSWIYTLKNECMEDDVTIMEWLSKQQNTKVAAGTYQAVAEGFDWGPGVTKIIVSLDKKVSASSVAADKFQIAVEKQGYFGNLSRGTRTITAAYTSDAKGNKTEEDASYLTFELAVGPSIDISNPFFYNFFVGFNVWADPYTNTITLTEGSTLQSEETEIVALNIEPKAAKTIKPQADKFKKGTYRSMVSPGEDIKLSYATYAPAKDDKKNPLIIWLHGAGEGGTDPDIALLGNNITLLAGENVQKHFDGAYVLAPQSDTMWMNDGSGNYTKDGTSKYTEALMELIRYYVNSNSDIDKNRVYIGGCSNGGYMTMNMILHYPEYFAAAYPICEAYTDAWITDEMLEGIKDLPIWFTHAANDPTVNPQSHTVATVDRLHAMGAANVHFSYFDDVHDTSGQYTGADGAPYQYNGHWSWIYTLKNECTEDGVSIMEWMSGQKKEDEPTTDDKTDKLQEELDAAKNELNDLKDKADKLQEAADQAVKDLIQAQEEAKKAQADAESAKAKIEEAKAEAQRAMAAAQAAQKALEEYKAQQAGQSVQETTIKVNKSKISLKAGKKKQIKVTVTNANGKKVTYKSSNKKVAKVSSKGKVTGVSKGKATITVKCNGVSRKVKVTVK